MAERAKCPFCGADLERWVQNNAAKVAAADPWRQRDMAFEVLVGCANFLVDAGVEITLVRETLYQAADHYCVAVEIEEEK